MPGIQTNPPEKITPGRTSPNSVTNLPGSAKTAKEGQSLIQNAEGYTQINSDKDLSLLNKVVTNKAGFTPVIKKAEGLKKRMLFLPSAKQQDNNNNIQQKLIDPKK